MKKVLILILALCIAFSLCLVTGCGENTPDQGQTTKSTTNSDESTSSITRPSRLTSKPGQSENSTGTTKPPVIAPGGSDGNNTQPSTPSVVPSGESLIITEMPIPSGISTNAKIVMMTINGIKSISPTNFRDKKELLDSIEVEFAKLTSAEKQEVANYSNFLAAKEKYEELNGKAVLIEWEELIGRTIPEANLLKNKDVENVYKANKMHTEYSTSIQTIENYSTYKAKLDACLKRIEDATVEEVFITQDMNGNGILEPSIVYNGTSYDEVTNVKGKRSVGNTFFGFSSLTVDNGSDDTGVHYTDKNNKNVLIWRVLKFKTHTFTAPNPGKLTLYVRVENSRDYAVKQNGETLFRKSSGNTEQDCIFEVDVKAGAVTIDVKDGDSDGYFIAIKFSYPNLG